MNDVAAALYELAEPSARGDRVKIAIARAARRAGLAYWRAYDIWYRKARRIEPFEVALVSQALERKRQEEARNEFRELKTRLLRLESRLVQTDAEFHREDISALQSTVRQRG
jgi:hypothetical protein